MSPSDGMIRIILISSVRPELTSAGQIILHRHLVNRNGLEVEVYGKEPVGGGIYSWIRRGVGRLGNSGLIGFAEDFWALWGGRWIDETLHELPKGSQAVVLTVAHGDGFGAAMRFARRHRLPLVSIFHDWWPDMPPMRGWARRYLERRFRALYAKSDLAFCVSEGMREELGEHPRVEILYPIPDLPHDIRADSAETDIPTNTKVFKVVYAGNLQDYGPMLGVALQSLRDHPRLRLEVRGADPRWSAAFREQMKGVGCWLPFAPRPELESWLATADAFLVPMEFDSRLRRRMETSFPSKIPEFARFGKPLVIWGPDYCAAVRWARQGERALCVTDPGPEALRAALESLLGSPSERGRLELESARSAKGEFDHDLIQAQFIRALEGVLERRMER